jgi:hypothetical protein
MLRMPQRLVNLMRQAQQGSEVLAGPVRQVGDKRVIFPYDGPQPGRPKQLANQPANREWAARRAMASGQDE